MGARHCEYYFRAGRRVLASCETGLYTTAVQFHPECGPSGLLRGLLLELTAVWRYPGLLAEFGLRADRTPHDPRWQEVAAVEKVGTSGLALEAYTRPTRTGVAVSAAQAADVLQAASDFLRTLSSLRFPPGCGPRAVAPWSGGRVRLFLTNDPACRRLPAHAWPAPPDINSGFQPSDTACLFCLRKEAQKSVVTHELVHVLLQDRSPGVVRMQQAFFGALGRCVPPAQIGPVTKPLEAYAEAVVNLVAALSDPPYLQRVLSYLRGVCALLATRQDRGAEKTQRTPVFSYFLCVGRS
jgi:hypothetical protein